MNDLHAAPTPSVDTRARCAVLPHLQVFSASGTDAIDFLHGQLTQDVRGQNADLATLAGYCTAKGRLLATLLIWRPLVDAQGDTDAPRVQALVRADVAESLLKRLRMFVLRAKATLAISPLQVAGVWTDGDPAELEAVAGGPLPREPWRRADLPSGIWIGAPASAGLRWWWVASDTQLQATGAGLRPVLQPGDAQTWRAADLAAGMPWIGASTQDLFIPQTVNLDLVGGISFTKGCYPGQEVVARSHYRGTVKRRMAYGVVAGVAGAEITPASDIYDAADPGSPCGRVVEAAGAHDAAILFEATLVSLSHADLHLGSATGPAITLRPLPYRLGQEEDQD
jgi:folate-binding protein YgfZ